MGKTTEGTEQHREDEEAFHGVGHFRVTCPASEFLDVRVSARRGAASGAVRSVSVCFIVRVGRGLLDSP